MMKAARSMCGCTCPSPARRPMEVGESPIGPLSGATAGGDSSRSSGSHDRSAGSSRSRGSDLDLAPAMPSRPHPADGAARHVPRRLDEDPDLAVVFGLGEDDEASIPPNALASPLRSLMPCVLRSRWSQPQESEVQGTRWWMPMGKSPVWHRPTPQREEPTRTCSVWRSYSSRFVQMSPAPEILAEWGSTGGRVPHVRWRLTRQMPNGYPGWLRNAGR